MQTKASWHIVIITRATLYTAPGGDTVQVDSTARYLNKLGIPTDIKLADQIIDYSKYDLLHFFNIIRPADILKHIHASGKPYVVSTIFVDYSEYDRYYREGILGYASRLLSTDTIEYLKAVARMFKNRERINSWSYLLKGHKNSVREVIKYAQCLLPNSHSEYKRLFQAYGIHQQYVKIPNAVDQEKFLNQSIAENKRKPILLHVGRIEGIKNQLNLIRAVNKMPYELYIIGKPSPNSEQYYQRCVKEASTNIHFMGHLSSDQVRQYYQQARVHILPSWFETTGLSSLEAAAMGCNIVVTDKGDTREYFRDYAFYCHPGDTESIRKAIDLAFATPFNENFRKLILQKYTWEKTATKTLEAYNRVLIVSN